MGAARLLQRPLSGMEAHNSGSNILRTTMEGGTMRRLTTSIVCLGVFFVLGPGGCGEEEELGGDDGRCEATCNKIIECEYEFALLVEFTLQECTDGCRESKWSKKDCVLGCKADVPCFDYLGLCLISGCDALDILDHFGLASPQYL